MNTWFKSAKSYINNLWCLAVVVTVLYFLCVPPIAVLIVIGAAWMHGNGYRTRIQCWKEAV